jgi:hypothetical protein
MVIYRTRRSVLIKYYSGGKPIRESTEAERFLKDRESHSAAGLQPLPCVDRITYWPGSSQRGRHAIPSALATFHRTASCESQGGLD